MENYSLSDIAAANGGGFGGNNSWVLILLFAMIFGGGGFFGGRNTDQAVANNEILSGQRFDMLSRQINQVGDGIASLGYSQLQNMSNNTASINGNITSEGRALQNQLANCCCTTQRAIDSVNYNIASESAKIMANDTANTQKILDQLSANRIHELEQSVSQLQLQNAMSGVVRYPSATTYNSGSNPFCGCNCPSI